jgi:putative ABC transport system substrate-binding protein
MRRRDFIKGIAGSTTAWPLVARAQQPSPPVIGFLRSTSLADAAHLMTGFRNGLKEAGLVEGQNVAVEYRSANDQLDRLPVLATDLISQQVAVIVANTNAALAAKAATTTVPVVFVSGSDPVRDGLVASLNRPGGNVTGVTFLSGQLGAKRLELLRELVPTATTIAMLANPNSPETVAERRDVQDAARAIKQQLIILDVNGDQEIETAFANVCSTPHRCAVLRCRRVLQLSSGPPNGTGGSLCPADDLCTARVCLGRRFNELRY